MDDTIGSLVHRNLMAVFNERDPERRSRAMAEVYADDVTFTDPGGVVSGREAIGRKAQEILDGAPGFVFAPAGAARRSGDLGVLSRQFGPEDGEPVVRGTGIAIVRDGRITALHTLLDG